MLQFQDICTKEHFAWQSDYYTAYRYTDDKPKTVFKYDIPYSEEKELLWMSRYQIPATERMQYYRNLALSIHQNVAITQLLCSNGIPSILAIEDVSQDTNTETGCSSIYLQTAEVYPILDKLFGISINLITLLDVFIRLSVIVRDIAKPPCKVTHRGISMNEVYINAENKILLGGFYYAEHPGSAFPPSYLPEHTGHLPQKLSEGGSNSPALDMQTLSQILYNFCSGLPWDTAWPSPPRIVPEFAPDELAEVLDFGMHCTDNDCNTFRRGLLDCRKRLSKTSAASVSIPVRQPNLKEFILQK